MKGRMVSFGSRAGRRPSRLALLTAAAMLALSSCQSDDRTVPPPPPDPGLFSGVGSPWTRLIPPDAPVEPRSDEYVRGLIIQPLVVSQLKWTIPLYDAHASTPRSDVELTADWAPRKTLRSVPIPEAARPDPAGDAHLVVNDTSTGCVYDFWGARREEDGRWTAQWAGALPAEGTGLYWGGLAARASGFSAAAGLILPEELRNRRIDHALVFAYPLTRAGGPVPPATNSDGRSSSPIALPQGARVQLDPSLNLDTLDLNTTERTIAEALQRYGMVLGDSSGGFTLYAAHPQSQHPDSFKGLLPAETWVSLDKIPVERFRVLKLGPVEESPRMPEVNRCAVYG